MLDLESELRAYATRLDERYPDVTLDELTTSPPDVSVQQQTSREHPGRALTLIAAAVVLMLVGALVLVARNDAGDGQVPAAPPGDLSAGSGLLAFAGSGESGSADIFVVAPDGTGLRALTSTSNSTVSSRSSTWRLTKGVPVRAVTFQSMVRTSSPGTYGRTSSNSMPRPLNTER